MINSCDSYTWNGVTYTTSGVYDALFINNIGCDSIATLDLTINYSNTSNTIITSCDSYTWNGVTYTTSGIYDTTFINNIGCDSVATLDLTITPSS